MLRNRPAGAGTRVEMPTGSRTETGIHRSQLTLIGLSRAVGTFTVQIRSTHPNEMTMPRSSGTTKPSST